MLPGDLSGDGQPEAGATGAAFATGVEADQAFEHPVPLDLGDARPIVGDVQLSVATATTPSLISTRETAYREALLTADDVLLYGLALTPATLLGAWTGKKVLTRVSDRFFVLLVEAGLVVAGCVFLIGR